MIWHPPTHQPLAEQLRPRWLTEVIGHVEHLTRQPVHKVARNRFAPGVADCVDKTIIEVVRGLLAPFPPSRSVASLARQN